MHSKDKLYGAFKRDMNVAIMEFNLNGQSPYHLEKVLEGIRENKYSGNKWREPHKVLNRLSKQYPDCQLLKNIITAYGFTYYGE